MQSNIEIIYFELLQNIKTILGRTWNATGEYLYSLQRREQCPIIINKLFTEWTGERWSIQCVRIIMYYYVCICILHMNGIMILNLRQTISHHNLIQGNAIKFIFIHLSRFLCFLWNEKRCSGIKVDYHHYYCR